MLAVSFSFLVPSSLTDAQRDEAFALASTACRLDRAWFEASLAGFDEVILYRERESGRLVGITGIRIIDGTHEGREFRAILTGAVTIDAAFRRHGLPLWAGIRTVLRHGVLTRRQLYWFSTTDSWRAYARVVGSCRDVWPRANRANEPELALLYRLTASIYGANWDAARRVCRPFARRQLRPEVAFIPPRILATSAHAREFASLNPGYAEGEGLPLLVRLDGASMVQVLRKMLAARGAKSAALRVENAGNSPR
jgi:hypothetical protein